MIDVEKRIKTKEQLNEWITYETSFYHTNVLDYCFQLTENAILKKFTIILRSTEYYINTGKKIRALLYKARLNKLQNKYGLHIQVNCCGKGLKIMHVGSILMNGKASLGNNCALHINTGIVSGGGDDDAPILEDGVVVGIGAVVLGGVHIAKNVAIGANAVVNKDVIEENIAVAGVPAKKISNNGRTEWNKKAKEKVDNK